MPNILFVCTANRCRSPMASALFETLLDTEMRSRWRVSSAGTWASDGLPAMPKAIRIMDEMSIDIRSHRSRHANAAILGAQDLILVMESNHREALSVEFPHLAAKIRLLTEMAGPPFDIKDPVLGATQDYRQTAHTLQSLLTAGLPQIRHCSTEHPAP